MRLLDATTRWLTLNLDHIAEAPLIAEDHGAGQHGLALAEAVLVAGVAASYGHGALARPFLARGRTYVDRCATGGGPPRRDVLVMQASLGDRLGPGVLRWIRDEWWRAGDPIEIAERAWVLARTGDLSARPALMDALSYVARDAGYDASAAAVFQATHLFLYATDFGRDRSAYALVDPAVLRLFRRCLSDPAVDRVDAVAELGFCVASARQGPVPPAALHTALRYARSLDAAGREIDRERFRARFHAVVACFLFSLLAGDRPL